MQSRILSQGRRLLTSSSFHNKRSLFNKYDGGDIIHHTMTSSARTTALRRNTGRALQQKNISSTSNRGGRRAADNNTVLFTILSRQQLHRRNFSSSSFTEGGATRAKSGGGSHKNNSNNSNNSEKSFFSTLSFSYIFHWYSKLLDTNPIITKCLSAGFISSIGNVLAQGINHRQQQQQKEEEKKQIEYENNSNDIDNTTKQKQQQEENQQQQPAAFQVDIAQVSRFALLNIVFVAPVLHHWYQFINKAVPGRSFSKVLQRTFWDEFIFSPMYIPVFLGMLWKLEGTTNDNIIKMIISECPSIIVAEWIVWVPTMIVTFRYIPVKFQVLIINLIGVFWQTFLAYAANNAHHATNNENVEKLDTGSDNGNNSTGDKASNDDVEVMASSSISNSSTSIIVEEHAPLVLNTLIGQNTPKPTKNDEIY